MLANDNSKIISKIPEILEVNRINFAKVNKILTEQSFAKNARKIFVYKITYRSQGHKVVGFIVEPRKGANLPCIIYNRGGSGEFGALKNSALFSKLPAELALNGYVVIASQYSGNAGGEGKDEMGGSDINDVLILQKILKKYSRVDANKIGMYGLSRGGAMTYLALSKVKWIKAVVTVGGMTNLARTEKLRPKMGEHFKKIFGENLKEKSKRSAILWVDRFYKKSPLLIMHGGSDSRISPLDSIELAQKLLEFHIPHRFVLFEGASHDLNEHRDESIKMTVSWFDRFVKNNESVPSTKLHNI